MSTPNDRSVVRPAGDPQIGNLATPVNSSTLTVWFINNLPAYRPSLSPQRRGLEIGMAHGYLLLGPFSLLGPLRNSVVPNLAGLLGTIGLIVILTACLFIYSAVGVKKPITTITAPNPPKELETDEGWSQFTSGFLVGGVGGALFAYLILGLLSIFGISFKGVFG
ncbi:MAG: photosystem I reaction center subunit XI [Cyanobacteria bacterium]|nr:photosystem I reaction center subunit XI [Cyanobacteriota bacterium]MDW8202116.1 photosystem I reaction center subunit XI [Cyanobacteriota bacterium SKYGB_h_bin112]